jgi:ribosomal protein L3 glutamine methyltransferase
MNHRPPPPAPPHKGEGRRIPPPRPHGLTTIGDYVQFAVTRFTAAKLVFAHGTNDPIAEAAFLVAEALNLAPDSVEVVAATRVGPREGQKILDLINARVRTRRPAAYLVQKIYQRGVAFFIDERAIVPRSYIGELLDGALFAGGTGALVDPAAVSRVLDLCTGSGCLAVLAAMRFPNATVDAVDISADALAVAAKNVAAHGLTPRVTLHHGDLFAPLGDARYDLIIANPPYVDAAGMVALPPECRYEPALAFDGGPDGIAIVRQIIDNAGQHLARNAGLLCEIGRNRPVLERAYPDTSFLWLDTEETSDEVFWLDAAQLV